MDGGERSCGTTCIPRRRARSHSRASRASLMDRIRVVVFRLIMVSASSSRGAVAQVGPRQGSCGFRSDSYRTEAVEDCIEFFKRSASGMETKGAGVTGADSVEVVVAFRPYPPCEA